MENIPEYSVAIRTLGTAGDKYRKMLESLNQQTWRPKEIFVYIADGYPIPKESMGIEKYIYVKKGMVAQRALQYKEITSEYILFLDDDVFLPYDASQKMLEYLTEYEAEIISPDVFHNAERSIINQIIMSIPGRMLAHKNQTWGYKVMRNSGYSYNTLITKPIYKSQTNAGPCFMCSKNTFLKTHFEDEIWLDKVPYPIGEDQAMFYKMYLNGYKQLTWYNSGVIHLDAGTTMQNLDKTKKLVFADFRFKTIFWHRFIYLPDKSSLSRLWSIICIGYTFVFSLLVSLIKLNFTILKIKINAIKDGVSFIRSAEYKQIPRIIDHTK